MNIILLSIIVTIIFGIIEALFFLTAEETLEEKLADLPLFNDTMAELLTGGISTAVAILVASTIKIYIEKNYKIIENPFIDSAGILIGTLTVVFIYRLFCLIKGIECGF